MVRQRCFSVMGWFGCLMLIVGCSGGAAILPRTVNDTHPETGMSNFAIKAAEAKESCSVVGRWGGIYFFGGRNGRRCNKVFSIDFAPDGTFEFGVGIECPRQQGDGFGSGTYTVTPDKNRSVKIQLKYQSGETRTVTGRLNRRCDKLRIPELFEGNLHKRE